MLKSQVSAPNKTAEALGRSPTRFSGPFQAAVARVTGGLSPRALSQSCIGWPPRLSLSPNQQIKLARAVREALAAMPRVIASVEKNP
jgi:hypothetical protein